MPRTRPFHRIAVATTVLGLLTLGGCDAAQDLTEAELPQVPGAGEIGDTIESARGSVETLERTLQDAAGLDDAARAQVETATTTAVGAIEAARAAAEVAGDTGAEAQAQVEEARAALTEAGAQLDAASAVTDGVVAEALGALRAEVDRLATELATAP